MNATGRAEEMLHLFIKTERDGDGYYEVPLQRQGPRESELIEEACDELRAFMDQARVGERLIIEMRAGPIPEDVRKLIEEGDRLVESVFPSIRRTPSDEQ